MIKIDKHSDRPIYKQIYDGFFKLIESGALKPGDAIPSERDLCEELKISRMTLRAAINQLERDGLLIRKHGLNTFVSATRIVKNALGFMSFSQDMHSRSMSASSKVIRYEERKAEESIAAKLSIPAHSPVVYLERVRLANQEPMALERVYLPAQLFPEILNFDFSTHSLYETLEKEYNCYPVIAEETIESVNLNQAEAELLGVTEKSPALLVKRITRDENGNSVEYVNTLYRADRYRIFLIRRRQHGKDHSGSSEK
jgi:GntR family transcriptional regulator